MQENEELKNATVTLAEGLNFQQERADKLEQECEKLINQRDKFEFGNNILEHERNNYKQALDEIELYCNKYPTNSIGFKQSILNIINKAKEQ